MMFFIFILASCNRYQKLPLYQESAIPQPPDYSQLEYWAAHPEKLDSSDRYPGKKPLANDMEAPVDVFFIHPTTFTKQKKIRFPNADLKDSGLNLKTDKTTILFQASAFHNGTRVFAPRYRQAHFNNYFTKDTTSAKKAFELAYEDVVKAFEYYLSEYNEGRPFIIAAHSQGTTHGVPLIKNLIDGRALQNKLVAAYLIGMKVNRNAFRFIKPCLQPEETGCFTSWRTYRKGSEPDENSAEEICVTNPVSWTMSADYCSQDKNLPSLLRNFDEIHPGLIDAQISPSVLWVTKPKFKGSFFLRTDNYHPADINFFYFSIYKNVGDRIDAYFSGK